MIRCTNKSSMFLAILVLLSPAIRAAEPNEGATTLRFELSPEDIAFSEPRDVLDGPRPPRTSLASWKPPYTVGIPLDGSTVYLPFIDGGDDRGFSAAAERSERLSQRQKEFLEATQWVFQSRNPFTYHRPMDPNRPREFLLYAMTLEDARALAQIYADVAVRDFESQVQFQMKRLKENEDIIGTLQKKMHDLEVAVQGAETAFAEVRKRVGYRTVQEATAAIAELDRMRNAALVDMVGIQAKIAAIQKWQTESAGATVLDRLKAMFVEESIALQAAEARMKMVMQLREEANKFVDARQILDNAEVERERLLGEINVNKNNADQTREWLEGSGRLRPRIAEWTIRIHPVEWR